MTNDPYETELRQQVDDAHRRIREARHVAPGVLSTNLLKSREDLHQARLRLYQYRSSKRGFA